MMNAGQRDKKMVQRGVSESSISFCCSCARDSKASKGEGSYVCVCACLFVNGTCWDCSAFRHMYLVGFLVSKRHAGRDVIVVVEIRGCCNGRRIKFSLLSVEDVLPAKDICFHEEVDKEGKVRGVDEESVSDHGIRDLAEGTLLVHGSCLGQDDDAAHHLQDLQHRD